MFTCSTMMGSSLLKLMTWLSNGSRRSHAVIYPYNSTKPPCPHELYATLVRKSATSDEVDATCKFHQHGGRNLLDPITSLPPTELHKQITSYIVTRKGKHGVSKFHGYIGKFPFSFTWKLSMSFLLGYFLPRKVLLGNHNAKEWDQSFYVVIPSHPTKQKVDGTIPSHLVPRQNSCWIDIDQFRTLQYS